jgi:hypothetical protein
MRFKLKIAVAAAALIIGFSGMALAQQMSVPAVTTNNSATITTGNTFQTILPALSSTAKRRSLTIQNNNAATSETCWLAFGKGITAANATKAESIALDVNHGTAYTRFFPYVPADEIEATCSSNSDTLYVDVQ